MRPEFYDKWEESHRCIQAGEAEVTAGKARGYTEGTADRLSGKKDTVVGAVTGDREQQASGYVNSDHLCPSCV